MLHWLVFFVVCFLLFVFWFSCLLSVLPLFQKFQWGGGWWVWPNSSRFHPGGEQFWLNSSHAAVNDSGSSLLPMQLICSWDRSSNQQEQSGWTGGNYCRCFNSLVKILMIIRQAAVEMFDMSRIQMGAWSFDSSCNSVLMTEADNGTVTFGDVDRDFVA